MRWESVRLGLRFADKIIWGKALWLIYAFNAESGRWCWLMTSSSVPVLDLGWGTLAETGRSAPPSFKRNSSDPQLRPRESRRTRRIWLPLQHPRNKRGENEISVPRWEPLVLNRKSKPSGFQEWNTASPSCSGSVSINSVSILNINFRFRAYFDFYVKGGFTSGQVELHISVCIPLQGQNQDGGCAATLRKEPSRSYRKAKYSTGTASVQR